MTDLTRNYTIYVILTNKVVCLSLKLYRHVNNDDDDDDLDSNGDDVDDDDNDNVNDIDDHEHDPDILSKK